MNKSLCILLIVLGLFSSSLAQKTLTYEEFVKAVEKNHPIAFQAINIGISGKQEVRKARGYFDPKIEGNTLNKDFKGISYFNYQSLGLKIPTWYGMELNGGFEKNNGHYINPDLRTPEDGFWQAGLSINLGKGLFIDKRRADLAKAKRFRELSRVQQLNMLNELTFNASVQYWNWMETWNDYKVMDKAVELAEKRYEAVKMSYEIGEEPSIDTLEAFIQLQNRMITRNTKELLFRKQSLLLSTFLWIEGKTPLEIDSGTTPILFDSVNISKTLIPDSIWNKINNHPFLAEYDYKLEVIKVDRRMKIEALKPEFKLGYNFLSESYNSQWQQENAKYSIQFAIPLFLRKERAALRLNTLKKENMQLERVQKAIEIKNKLKAMEYESNNYQKQVEILKINARNYRELLEAEIQKFEAGESSLFLINSRETRYLDSQLQLINHINNYKTASSGINYFLSNIN